MSGGESNGSGIGATLSAGLDIYNFVDSLLFAKTFKNVTKAAERVMPPPGNEVESFWFYQIFMRTFLIEARVTRTDGFRSVNP